ncbi:MAG: LLM class F420-dependent oxidoreductase [Deltaproteobacteria bacterium]|nr:LLM class F420-dependent oxidoreductase [Deltaproteobacteria bacterium]MBW2361557.1 LLM class F420-dependent oxidoreductase [Deltaproteobacteria bacterium]
MKVGIVYPQPEIKGDIGAISKIARAVEARGFDHLLVYDHVLGVDHADRDRELQGPYTDRDPFTDPLTMFAYLAGITERIQLMSGVLILPQRQTPLVARQAADIDLLSDGRLVLGIGLGWNHVECQALGVDFATRGIRCTEQIELLRKLWSGELVSFDGRFEQAERVRLNPPPSRQIPIWIGGFAAPAIERTGRLADGFIAAGPIEFGIQAKASVDESRAKHGRAEQEFGHTFVTLVSTNEDDVVASAEKWRAAGGTHVSISTMGMGFGTSLEAHLDFIGRVADRLGVSRS